MRSSDLKGTHTVQNGVWHLKKVLIGMIPVALDSQHITILHAWMLEKLQKTTNTGLQPALPQQPKTVLELPLLPCPLLDTGFEERNKRGGFFGPGFVARRSTILKVFMQTSPYKLLDCIPF